MNRTTTHAAAAIVCLLAGFLAGATHDSAQATPDSRDSLNCRIAHNATVHALEHPELADVRALALRATRLCEAGK